MRHHRISRWKENFNKRIKTENGHHIWIGRFSGSTPMFYISKKAIKELNLRNNSCFSARQIAHLIKYNKMPDTNLYPYCGDRRCVNIDHMKDHSEVHHDRDATIKNLYANYKKWGKYNMSYIGKEFKLTRQRIKQIVG